MFIRFTHRIPCDDPLLAEAVIVKEALCFATNMCISKAMIELDNAIVVKGLQWGEDLLVSG